MFTPLSPDRHGHRLMAAFPTRFHRTDIDAMTRSSLEVSGSSTVYLMPSGVFTWTGPDDRWLHPDLGTRHHVGEFMDEVVHSDESPTAVEVAWRQTTDRADSWNFGRWETADIGELRALLGEGVEPHIG